MKRNDKLIAGFLAAELITYTPAAEIERHSDIQEFFNPPAYEQTMEDIDLEKITGVSLEDMAQGGYDYFEQKKQLEEITKRSNSPPPYSDRPPPTTQEMADNLRELQQEHISINKELTDTQSEYNKNMREAKKESNYYDKRAEDMENRLSEISNRKNPKSREQAYKQFEKEYHIKPQDAPEKIKELREQSSKIKEELQPIEEKIQSLKNSQKQNEQEYKNQINEISRREDKQLIMDKLEQSRKDEEINPRDIAGLRDIEKSIADTQIKEIPTMEHDIF